MYSIYVHKCVTCTCMHTVEVIGEKLKRIAETFLLTEICIVRNNRTSKGW